MTQDPQTPPSPDPAAADGHHGKASTAGHLRLWPGVVIVLLQFLATFGSGVVAPATPLQFFGMMGGPALGLLAIFLWWIFASRAPRVEKALGVILPPVAFALAIALAHPSAPTAIYVYGLPFYCALFVAAVSLFRAVGDPRRRLAIAAAALVGAGLWTMVRTDGVGGDMAAEFAWRWSESAEERFLDSGAAEVEGGAVAAGEVTRAAWPGLRGEDRDGVVRGVSLETDWQSSPPETLWRRPVGPGWGSFAVAGELLYTQEQRGEEEAVIAYRRDTGEPVWQHADPVRFWEPLAGAGPRATPTLEGGRLYALGATGLLSALDAADGSLLWQRDLVADTGAAVPEWGFTSSPLLLDDSVIVHSGAADGKGLVAYDAESGEPRWFATAGALSYASAHLATLHGQQQLILPTNESIAGYSPSGEVLWLHEWPVGGARIVQPAITPDGGVIIGTGFGVGTRRLEVAPAAGGWQVEESWTSTRLKPYYNDLVLHEGHVYGFDGRILACLDLATGELQWKGGRYGNGQLLLLPDQDLLLVTTDRGEVALVKAEPGGFEELAKVPAIDGKTWNHPVLVDGVLYLRNAEEMAALRLPSR